MNQIRYVRYNPLPEDLYREGSDFEFSLFHLESLGRAELENLGVPHAGRLI